MDSKVKRKRSGDDSDKEGKAPKPERRDKKRSRKKRTKRSRSVNEGDIVSGMEQTKLSIDAIPSEGTLPLRRSSAPSLSDSNHSPRRTDSWRKLPRATLNPPSGKDGDEVPATHSFSAPETWEVPNLLECHAKVEEPPARAPTRNRQNRFPSLPFLWRSSPKRVHKSAVVVELDKSLKRMERGLSEMDLSHQKLDSLPDRLFTFSALLDLNLSMNVLEEVPSRIAALSTLTKLNLSQNRIRKLPAELGSLSACRTLNVATNRLQALPPLSMNHLSALCCEFNQIEELPDLSGVKSLTRISAFVNSLSTLPDSLYDLGALTELDVGVNRIASLPPAIGQLASLTKLNISGNRLKELPAELGNLKALQVLDARLNYFKTVPACVTELPAIKKLHFSRNRINKLPGGWNRCSALQVLALDRNHIKTLPEQLCECSELRDLIVSHNRLKALPDALGALASLRVLDVSDNALLTTLPMSCARLANLRKLCAENCGLSAVDPELLAELRQLESLELNNNGIEEIPMDIANLHKLRTLRLGMNRIRSVPREICQLTKLRTLMLSWNEIEELPEEMGELVGLMDLHVQHNRLTTLPPSIGGLTKLERLLAGGNAIDHVPAELGSLPRLKELFLSDNELVDVPDAVTLLRSLEKLYLSNVGSITSLPDGIAELTKLRVLHVEGNAGLQQLPEKLLEMSSLCEVCASITQVSNVFAAIEDRALSSITAPAFLSLVRKNDGIDGPLGTFIASMIMEATTTLRSNHFPFGSAVILQYDTVNNFLIMPTDSRMLVAATPEMLAEFERDKGDFIPGLPEVSGEDHVVDINWAEMRGVRTANEDAIVVAPTFTGRDGVHFMAVLDGHGGAAASVYASARIPVLLSQYLQCRFPPEEALYRAFAACHMELLSSKDQSGTTVAAVFILQNILYTANAGDSRTVICKEGQAERLSVDHRATDDEERERICKAGGFISENGRVMGDLSVSRSLGDAGAQPYISYEPYMTTTRLSDSHEFIIVGCDGLWDHFADQEACDFVRRYPREEAAQRLRNEAYGRGSSDNISVGILYLRGWRDPS